MAVPKQRTSKKKRDMRRAQHKLTVPLLIPCPHCHELKPAHRVCLSCGYYKEREVVKVN
ncbi:MAG: 50S ribosomal protein L32 [Clostridia bacterium]|nr:50S ribosomal protein L32 [Clostridia bacterium]